MTTYDSLIVQALRRMDIVFKEVKISSPEEKKFFFFKIILSGKEFYARVEKVERKRKKKKKFKKRTYFELTFFSGVYVDKSLEKDSQERLSKKIKKMNRDDFTYLEVSLDVDGEIVFSVSFHTEGTSRGLENYYLQMMEFSFKEISKHWRELMEVYYS